MERDVLILFPTFSQISFSSLCFPQILAQSPFLVVVPSPIDRNPIFLEKQILVPILPLQAPLSKFAIFAIHT